MTDQPVTRAEFETLRMATLSLWLACDKSMPDESNAQAYANAGDLLASIDPAHRSDAAPDAKPTDPVAQRTEKQPSKLEGAGPGAAGVAEFVSDVWLLIWALDAKWQKVERSAAPDVRSVDPDGMRANIFIPHERYEMTMDAKARLLRWCQSQPANPPTDSGNGDAVRALREVLNIADLTYDQVSALHKAQLDDRFTGIRNVCHDAIARLEAEGRQP